MKNITCIAKSLFLNDFWQSYKGLLPTTKKESKIVFGATPSMKFPFNSYPQKPSFSEH